MMLLKSMHMNKKPVAVTTETVSCRPLMLLQRIFRRKTPAALFAFEGVNISAMLSIRLFPKEEAITRIAETVSCRSLVLPESLRPLEVPATRTERHDESNGFAPNEVVETNSENVGSRIGFDFVDSRMV